MNELLTVLTGLASAAALGVTKSATDAVDARATRVFKGPMGPIAVLALSALLPVGASALGLVDVPKADAFAAAPAATVIGIAARELAKSLTRRFAGKVRIPERVS